jgi:hypothetical protein
MTRTTYWILLALALTSSVGMLSGRATAQQVPPHPPGTICFTQYFWCWAQPPGPPGTPCACPGPYGWVSGIRG